jgi:hypothetical protein
MLAVVRKPVKCTLDLVGLEMHQVVDGSQGDQLRERARRGDGWATPIRLEPGLRHSPVTHPQEQAGEVSAVLVLPLPGGVGLPHHPRVPRVQEVIDEGGAISHVAVTGSASRSFLTSGSTDATT